jgi:hypothetical protein
MKPLAASFKADGFHFRQRWREGNVALFEKSKDGSPPSFEVVRVQRRKARRAFGKVLPASEVMPSSERWGRDGWTFCDLASAQGKFRELAEAQERPAFGTPEPKNKRLRAGKVAA